jgi:small basic protein
LLKVASKPASGVVAGILIWLVMQFTQQNNISYLDAVIIAAVGSVIGLVIDALESQKWTYKRKSRAR